MKRLITDLIRKWIVFFIKCLNKEKCKKKFDFLIKSLIDKLPQSSLFGTSAVTYQ